jgi:hypothetical protein
MSWGMRHWDRYTNMPGARHLAVTRSGDGERGTCDTELTAAAEDLAQPTGRTTVRAYRGDA